MNPGELLLNRMKLGASVAASVELDVEEDLIFNSLLYKLRAEILSERVLDTDVTVSFTGSARARLRRIRDAVRVVRGKPVEATVRGEVTIPATYWRRFPEATIRYPDSLGSPVKYCMLGEALWEQTP